MRQNLSRLLKCIAITLQYTIICNYHIVGNTRGQDEAIPVFWLATGAGNGPILPVWDYRFDLALGKELLGAELQICNFWIISAIESQKVTEDKFIVLQKPKNTRIKTQSDMKARKRFCLSENALLTKAWSVKVAGYKSRLTMYMGMKF